MSSNTDEDLLHSRLQQLQSRFTWELKTDDFELDDLSRQLQHDLDLQLGQPGAVANSYSFLAYVRYLQDKPEEALSLLNQSEQKLKECYGEDSERRLIVTYGDLAWLKYHTGDHTESQSYCQRVQDILAKHPADSSAVLHPEVYGEKAWTFLKFSKSYYPKAIECFRRALELQPDDCEFNNGYAIALYRTEPYVLELCDEESPATKQLRRALEINPDDGVLMSMLALKLLYYQKYSEADGLVERALEIGPDDTQILRYVAKYLQKQKQVDWAIDLLKKTLKNNSQSAFIHYRLGLCYNKKKTELFSRRPRPDRAEAQHWRRLSVRHMEEAIRLKSTLNSTKAELALLYAEDRDITRARQLFKNALETVEEESESICQIIYRCYAEFCQYHDFQEDLAITYYKKVLECRYNTSVRKFCVKKLKNIAERRLNRNPRDAAAYGLLGAVAREEGTIRRAVAYYEKALEEDGDNDEYLSAIFELRLELK
ncbi:interferon-induced protein with tetratricopeptide repeats 5-like isoform 1-T1 [Odontesthes bonariensis]|uniref:interferon-induced protein with tetratricopeptide repeats 5-like isoform X1 n=1 Tax=Odontesthes bonariensis TaxID=219752 RepID=UPI003F5853DC